MPTDLWCLIFLSISGYFITVRLISKFRDVFVRANLFGIDLCKPTGAEVRYSGCLSCTGRVLYTWRNRT
ncbi:unnamed protein product [Allacma fusca]|uniref:Uncharacterized protein n=1 Tax=Allacma fusca TaxID=39272 RepID=A0A8J2KQV8_9HEXA|nr:unnamed protein product [Allacma fusca]